MAASQSDGLEVVGQLGGPTRAVALHSRPWNHPIPQAAAYVGRGPRVLAYPACTPELGSPIGRSEVLPGPVLDLFPRGRFLYAALGSAGLAVLDVSEPWRPTLLRVVPLYGVSARLVPEGARLYVVSGYGGLRILSLDDPSEPRELGHFQAVVSDAAVVGHYAFVVKRDFTVVDVLDPAAPNQIRKLADWADAVALQGTTLVVAVSEATGGAAREGALRVFDVSDPAQPRARGALPIGPPARLLRFVDPFLVAFQPAHARVVDVEDPDRPRDLLTFPAPGTVTGMTGGLYRPEDLTLHLAAGPLGLRTGLARVFGDAAYREAWTHVPLADAQALAVVDHIAYVEDEGAAPVVRMYDLRDPALPHEMAQVSLAVANDALAGADGKLYVGDPEGVLHVADVSDPGRPRLVGRLALHEPIWGLAPAGDRVIVAADEHVRVIDVSDAARPVEIGAARASGGATAIVVSGTMAFVTGPATGLDAGRPSLMAFEVSSAGRPREVGVLPDAAAWRHGLAARDGIVYVGGLQVVDASDPSAMREIARLAIDGELRALALSGDRMYAAMRLSDGGRLIELDVADPAAPRERSSIALVDEALDVEMWRGHAVVAAKESGLWVVGTDRRLPPPTSEVPAELSVKLYFPITAAGFVGVPYCR